MYKVLNLTNNPNVRVLDQSGPFTVIEHQKDLSVPSSRAIEAYYASAMGIRKRQLICNCASASVVIQAGAMQWMVGDIECTTGIKGIGDFFGKSVRGKITGESAVKPEYRGDGVLVLEPTEKFILLLDLGEWNGSVTLDDGLFLACEASVNQNLVARSTLSSAVAGKEGLFNLGLTGRGMVALESPCPKEEVVEVILQNDVLKIDGNFAIAWSQSLKFTVEKSAKSLMGSVVAGEGLVNVYRGTGKVWLAPTV